MEIKMQRLRERLQAPLDRHGERLRASLARRVLRLAILATVLFVLLCIGLGPGVVFGWVNEVVRDLMGVDFRVR